MLRTSESHYYYYHNKTVLFTKLASAHLQRREHSRAFKVTLGCHHLDAQTDGTVCITCHLMRAASRTAPASPFCSLSLMGKVANSSHVF